MTTDYGFCFHWAFQQTPDRVDATMQAIADVRAVRVRTAAPWLFVQTSKTTFEWAGTDYAVNKALEVGLQPLLLVNGRPGWGPSAADYGDFARLCALRYGPDGIALTAGNKAKGRHVRDFELWNEENHAFFWQSFPVSPNDFTAYVKAAYTGIKSVMPGSASTVVLGGFNPTGDGGFGWVAQHPVGFLSKMYDAGVKGYFDAVGMHPYTMDDPNPAPTPASTYVVVADQLHDLMVAKGDGAKKLWSTESGWAVPTTVTAAQQAQFFEDWAALWASKPYAGPWFAYEFRDEGTDISQREMMFGVVDNALRPKAAWHFFNKLNGFAAAPALSGSGTLTARAVTTHAAKLAGAGVLTAAAFLSAAMPAPLSGEGSLTAVVERYGAPAASLSGDGALEATVTPAFQVPAALSGSGSLTAAVDRLSFAVPVALAGSGSLTASVGQKIAAKNYTYDFGANGSSKPTNLFTDFGFGYKVEFGLANSLPANADGYWYSGGIYKFDQATNDMQSSVVVGNAGNAYDRSAMAIVRSNPEGTRWVGCTGRYGGGNACQILMCIDGVITELSPTPTAFRDFDRMTLVADGNVYTVLNNVGQVVNTWVDVDNVFTPYAGKRTGFGFQHVRSGGFDYASPGIFQKWFGQDLRDKSATTVPAVALTGGGQLTASVIEAEFGTAPLSGAGTLTAVTVPAVAGALAGDGALSATIVARHFATAALSGGGTLTGDSKDRVTRGADLNGAGALSAVVVPVIAKSAALAGAGSLSAIAGAALPSALSGSGQLVVTSLPVHQAVAALAGGGALSASTPTPVVAVPAALAGEGVLSASVAQAAQPPAYLGVWGPATQVNGFTTSLTTSIASVTTSGTKRAGIVVVPVYASNTGSFGTRSATWGGTAMTLLGIAESGNVALLVFGILNPPTAASTVSATVGSGGNAGRQQWMAISTWTGVSSFGAAQIATPSGAGYSQAVTGTDATKRVVHGICSTDNLSGYNQTQRAYGNVGGNFLRGLLGDALGDPSLVFTAAAGSVQHASIAVPLIP